MTSRLLFVDDEPNVLDALRRLLRKNYEFDTALGPEEGLGKLAETDYAVIISDMRMPVMTGDVFLARAHEIQPDAIQIILSGQADLESTVNAVNNGDLFRFLLKPADREVLTAAVDAALKQYRLVQAERELLEQTLSGAVEALTEVLSLVSPAATRRTNLTVEHTRRIAEKLGMESDWQLRVTALLSAIGYTAIPSDIVERSDSGGQLTPSESEMIRRHPTIAKALLGHIPRLEDVAGIISAQAGVDPPPAGLETHVAVLDLATAITDGLLHGHDLEAIVASLRTSGKHSEGMLAAFVTEAEHREPVVLELPLKELESGMLLRSDVHSAADVHLASANTLLTPTLLERLSNFDEASGVRQPILVEVQESDRIAA